jgi:hypothetical protein
MSAIVILGGVLWRNARVKEFIDGGVTRLIDSFTGRKAAKPTREQEIQFLNDMLGEMAKPGFPDRFDTANYFEFLLTLVTQTCFLRSRGLVIRDFYASQYHLCFPRPMGQPQPVTKDFPRAKAAHIVSVDSKLYSFYAVPATDAAGKPTLEALRELTAPPPPQQPPDFTETAGRKAVEKRLGVAEGAIRRLMGVGTSSRAHALVLLSVEDPSGDEDIALGPDDVPQTRASLVTEIGALLNLGRQ